MKKHLLLSIIFAFTLLTTACGVSQKGIKGDKNIVEKEFPISNYTQIVLNGINDIVYKQIESDKPHLLVEIDSNLLQYVSVTVKDGELHIDLQQNLNIKPSRFIVYTSSKDLTNISLNGVGDFKAKEKVRAEHININLTGVGDVVFNDLETASVHCKLSGVGDIVLSGNAESSQLNLSGVGDIKAQYFEQGSAICHLSGVGNIEVYAKNKLEAKADGVGDIKYVGNPTENTISASGVGKVKKID